MPTATTGDVAESTSRRISVEDEAIWLRFLVQVWRETAVIDRAWSPA